MPQKLTFEFVKRYFNDNGCPLLEEVYINNSIKMKYRCSCGNIAYIAFKKFKIGRRCMKCSGNEKYTLDEIREIFKKNNYTLLSTVYINALQKLDYMCPNNHFSSISISAFIRSNRCKRCAELEKHSQEHINQYFKDRGCECLDVYINYKTKMKYRCFCGNIAYMKFNKFQQGQRCRSCLKERTSGENHHWWNPDREQIKLNKLLSRKCSYLVRRVLKLTGQEKLANSEILCGYTRKQLLEHLQKDPLFDEWVKDSNNYQIDHILPIISFTEHNISDVSIINHLSNLQILTREDNLEKSDFYLEENFQSYIINFNLNSNYILLGQI